MLHPRPLLSPHRAQVVNHGSDSAPAERSHPTGLHEPVSQVMSQEELRAKFAMGTYASLAPQFSPSMSPPATFSVLTDSVSLVGMLTVREREARKVLRVGREKEEKSISVYRTILTRGWLGHYLLACLWGPGPGTVLIRLCKSAARTLQMSRNVGGLW